MFDVVDGAVALTPSPQQLGDMTLRVGVVPLAPSVIIESPLYVDEYEGGVIQIQRLVIPEGHGTVRVGVTNHRGYTFLLGRKTRQIPLHLAVNGYRYPYECQITLPVDGLLTFKRDVNAYVRVSSLLFDFATGPDIVRLLAVPVFGWAAYRDIKTRRVPNRTWLPLVAAGILALVWDVWLITDGSAFQQRRFAVQVLLSVGLVAPLGYVFWRIGGFGGADAKAIMTLALLLPVYPTFFVGTGAYPPAGNQPPLGVFSLSILSNTVIIGLAYPFVLAGRNALRGAFTPAMFIGRAVSIEAVLTEYGRLLETPEGFTRGGLDIDALRMYLRWRGVSFETVRANPKRYRLPLPTERNDPGDGSIRTDERALTDGGVAVDSDGRTEAGTESAIRPLDAWSAERFLEEHSAYGTTPEELREGLEVLTEPDRESVWITPGVPFIVPMFVGLLVALSFGDLLFVLLGVFGAA
jgi:preflagellin peptidase FlaK